MKIHLMILFDLEGDIYCFLLDNKERIIDFANKNNLTLKKATEYLFCNKH